MLIYLEIKRSTWTDNRQCFEIYRNESSSFISFDERFLMKNIAGNSAAAEIWLVRIFLTTFGSDARNNRAVYHWSTLLTFWFISKVPETFFSYVAYIFPKRMDENVKSRQNNNIELRPCGTENFRVECNFKILYVHRICSKSRNWARQNSPPWPQ